MNLAIGLAIPELLIVSASGLLLFCSAVNLLFGFPTFCSITIISFPCKVTFYGFSMRRVTFTLEEADHLALKLLAIHEQKVMVAVLQEVIRTYLKNKDAYLLSVTKREKQ